MAVRPKRLILPALIVALVGAIVWSMMTKSVAVEAAVLVTGPVRDAVEEEGRTRVVDRYVIAAPVSGRLQRIAAAFEEGEEVTEKDVIATLDPLTLRSRVTEAQARIRALSEELAGVDRQRPKQEEIDRARLVAQAAKRSLEVATARLEEADAALAQATRDADRAASLVEKGAMSPSEGEAAALAKTQSEKEVRIQTVLQRVRELEADAAELQISILTASRGDVDWKEASYRERIKEEEARLSVLLDDLGRTEIRPPVAGVILRRFVESETPVTAGTALFEIGDLTRLEVEADVLSEEAAHMREGMPVEVFGRALGDQVLAGTLQRIYPSAFEEISSLGVEQQRVTIVVKIDPKGTALKDGYRVAIRVILEERASVLLVPETALFRHQGGWAVFLADGDRARLRAVRTGLRDGLVREVLEGLADGDRVIVHPGTAVEDGVRIDVTVRR